jgi:hypothetical protein
MLPDFIVVGSMKCGTTSLYYQLYAHKEVKMSIQKETNFFISECDFEKGNYEKGQSWYESRFPEGGIARGECSPNYTKAHLFPGVAERMQELLPDVRLVYMVRDPIERLVSHYVQNRAQGLEDRPFYKAVTEPVDNKYVLTSRYFWQLEPYLEFFDLDQILVQSLESYSTHPTKTLHDIHSFIGVDPEVTDRQLKQGHFNSTSEKRIRGVWYRWLSGLLSQPVKDTLRPYIPLSWIPGTPLKRPKLSRGLRHQLVKSLQEDVDSLRELTGNQFEQWDL